MLLGLRLACHAGGRGLEPRRCRHHRPIVGGAAPMCFSGVVGAGGAAAASLGSAHRERPQAAHRSRPHPIEKNVPPQGTWRAAVPERGISDDEGGNVSTPCKDVLGPGAQGSIGRAADTPPGTGSTLAPLGARTRSDQEACRGNTAVRSQPTRSPASPTTTANSAQRRRHQEGIGLRACLTEACRLHQGDLDAGTNQVVRAPCQGLRAGC
jgi:hypothetical protein